ncbi:serum amyloid P-component-like isoform X1 [Takifugu flavidus]|uniref:serum amyloid P-component-like isoform X1 n=1 Tax=Takifugu flavidus TaxID=433684 RepID=UPI002544D24E|nr:serum amyloid P-component-like isoform X1 [Takifugu flavidus]
MMLNLWRSSFWRQLHLAGIQMEKLLLILVALAPCWAADLSGKLLIFPRESNIDHVKLKTSKTVLNSVTTCFRFKTDMTKSYSILSVATAVYTNAFLLFKTDEENVFRVHVLNGAADFRSVPIAPNTWQSMCTTWDSATGLAQLWLNGESTVKRYVKNGPITGPLSIVLGQDQDTYGGGFDAKQSLVAMLSDFHMWDYVLPAAEIRLYMKGLYVTPGNVFDWRNIQHELAGKVILEKASDVV